MSNFSTRALKLIILIIIITFVLLSLFSHPVGDDFCNAAKSQNLGFWNAQVFWYQNHTGRYFGQAVISIYPFFFNGYKFAVLSLFVTFFVALSTLLKAISGSWISNREAHWASLGLFAIYLTRLPSTVEGFYWLSGSVNYTLPCILLMFLLSLMVATVSSVGSNYRFKFGHIVAAMVLSVGIVGSNENIASVLILICFFGVIVTTHAKDPSSKTWKIVLVIALLSFTISILAPGNWARAARTTDVERTLTIVLLKSALSFVKWFSLWILDPALWSASVLLVPSVVAIYRKSPQWKRIPSSKPFLIISVVVWLILTFAPFFISLFAGGYIPRRTVNTSYLIFLLGWFGCLGISSLVLADKKSHWIQFIIPPSYIRSAAQWVLILVLVLVGRFPGAAKDLLVYAPIADVQLKNRLMIIRQSGTHGDIVVPPLESIPHTILNEDTLTPNAELFYNKCQAEFFRVRSVVTSSP